MPTIRNIISILLYLSVVIAIILFLPLLFGVFALICQHLLRFFTMLQ